MRRHLSVGVVLVLVLACQGESDGAVHRGATEQADASEQVDATHQNDAVRAAAPQADSGREAIRLSAEELTALRTAAEASPAASASQRRLAIALHDAGQREDSVEFFERVLKLDPSNRSRVELALVYGSLSRLVDAERLYREILAGDPGHAVALHNLGNIQAKTGREIEAIAMYRQALEIKPDYLLAWVRLGDSYRRTEQFRDAYRAYERALVIDPVNIDELAAFDDAIYQMAALDIAMGAPQRAQILLEELLQGNPDHAKANYAYGKLMLQAGRQEEADRAFERHMRILEENQPTGTAATDR